MMHDVINYEDALWWQVKEMQVFLFWKELWSISTKPCEIERKPCEVIDYDMVKIIVKFQGFNAKELGVMGRQN